MVSLLLKWSSDYMRVVGSKEVYILREFWDCRIDMLLKAATQVYCGADIRRWYVYVNQPTASSFTAFILHLHWVLLYPHTKNAMGESRCSMCVFAIAMNNKIEQYYTSSIGVIIYIIDHHLGWVCLTDCLYYVVYVYTRHGGRR